MGPLRLIHGCTYEDQENNLSDAILLQVTGSMAPIVLLRMLRTLLFVRACALAPSLLLDWIFASRKNPASWVAVTFVHLQQVSAQSEVLVDCREWSLQEWCQCARANRKGLQLSLIKAYMGSSASLLGCHQNSAA